MQGQKGLADWWASSLYCWHASWDSHPNERSNISFPIHNQQVSAMADFSKGVKTTISISATTYVGNWPLPSLCHYTLLHRTHLGNLQCNLLQWDSYGPISLGETPRTPRSSAEKTRGGGRTFPGRLCCWMVCFMDKNMRKNGGFYPLWLRKPPSSTSALQLHQPKTLESYLKGWDHFFFAPGNIVLYGILWVLALRVMLSTPDFGRVGTRKRDSLLSDIARMRGPESIAS